MRRGGTNLRHNWLHRFRDNDVGRPWESLRQSTAYSRRSAKISHHEDSTLTVLLRDELALSKTARFVRSDIREWSIEIPQIRLDILTLIDGGLVLVSLQVTLPAGGATLLCVLRNLLKRVRLERLHDDAAHLHEAVQFVLRIATKSLRLRCIEPLLCFPDVTIMAHVFQIRKKEGCRDLRADANNDGVCGESVARANIPDGDSDPKHSFDSKYVLCDHPSQRQHRLRLVKCQIVKPKSHDTVVYGECTEL